MASQRALILLWWQIELLFFRFSCKFAKSSQQNPVFLQTKGAECWWFGCNGTITKMSLVLTIMMRMRKTTRQQQFDDNNDNNNGADSWQTKGLECWSQCTGFSRTLVSSVSTWPLTSSPSSFPSYCCNQPNWNDNLLSASKYWALINLSIFRPPHVVRKPL